MSIDSWCSTSRVARVLRRLMLTDAICSDISNINELHCRSTRRLSKASLYTPKIGEYFIVKINFSVDV